MDHIYSQNVFEASLGTLPYPLLADWHKTTVKKYYVFNQEDKIAIRSCFLIDKNGIIIYANPAFDPNNKDNYEEIISACSNSS